MDALLLEPVRRAAGAEKSGAGAANAELFRGRRVVITPLRENPAQAVDKVNQAWSTCGARTSQMTPEQHDEVFAAVSGRNAVPALPRNRSAFRTGNAPPAPVIF